MNTVNLIFVRGSLLLALFGFGNCSLSAQPSGSTPTAQAASMALSIPPGGASISVPANIQWSETDYVIDSGTTVKFTATGKVQIADKLLPFIKNDIGPGGQPHSETHRFFTDPKCTTHALIGKIGPEGIPFVIGESKTMDVSSAGKLYMGINAAAFKSNTGSLQVKLEQLNPPPTLAETQRPRADSKPAEAASQNRTSSGTSREENPKGTAAPALTAAKGIQLTDDNGEEIPRISDTNIPYIYESRTELPSPIEALGNIYSAAYRDSRDEFTKQAMLDKIRPMIRRKIEDMKEVKQVIVRLVWSLPEYDFAKQGFATGLSSSQYVTWEVHGFRYTVAFRNMKSFMFLSLAQDEAGRLGRLLSQSRAGAVEMVCALMGAEEEFDGGSNRKVVFVRPVSAAFYINGKTDPIGIIRSAVPVAK